MTLLNQSLCKALNVLLREQPSVDLTPLEGDSLGIYIEEFKQAIALNIENGQFIASDYQQTDVRFSGRLGDILPWLAQTQDPQSTDDSFPETWHIEGKIVVLQRFQRVFRQLHFDWQTFLAQFLPNSLAMQGASLIETTFEQSQQFRAQSKAQFNNLQQQFHAQCFVPRSEFSFFCQELSALEARLETLSNRISRLNPRLEP